jgi:LTXXQ motif family protein
MTLFSGRKLMLSLVLVTPLACANEEGGSQTASSSNAATTTPSATMAPKAATSASAALVASAMPRPRFHGAGSVGSLIAAARDANLKDDQKTKLDAIEDELKDNPAERGKEMRPIHDAVIEGVKAGKVDATKITPLYADIDKAAKEHEATEAKALGELHDLLDATQRAAVVKTIRDKHAKRDEMQTEREKSQEKPDPAKMKERDQSRAKHRMEMLTRELGLDDEQQKKVEQIVNAKDKPFAPDAWKGRFEDGKKRSEAVLTAFEKEKFDATKLALAAPPSKMLKQGMDKHVAYLNALLPILKPEQREKLAASLGRGGGMMGALGPMGPMGPGGPGMRRPGGPGGPGRMGMGPMMRPGRGAGFGFPLDEEPPPVPGGEE